MSNGGPGVSILSQTSCAMSPWIRELPLSMWPKTPFNQRLLTDTTCSCTRMVGCAEASVEPLVGLFIRSGVVAIICCGPDWHGERFFWKRRMPIRRFSAKPSRWKMASTFCLHFSTNHFSSWSGSFSRVSRGRSSQGYHTDNKWRDLS